MNVPVVRFGQLYSFLGSKAFYVQVATCSIRLVLDSSSINLFSTELLLKGLDLTTHGAGGGAMGGVVVRTGPVLLSSHLRLPGLVSR